MLEDVAYISRQVKVVVTQSVQGTTQVASFLKHFKRFYFHCNAKFLVLGNQLVPRRKSGNGRNGLSVVTTIKSLTTSLLASLRRYVTDQDVRIKLPLNGKSAKLFREIFS